MKKTTFKSKSKSVRKQGIDSHRKLFASPFMKFIDYLVSELLHQVNLVHHGYHTLKDLQPQGHHLKDLRSHPHQPQGYHLKPRDAHHEHVHFKPKPNHGNVN